jgi:beta-galactosidase GanA
MIAQLGANEFLVTGVHARIDFKPADAAKQRQFLRVEEGSYEQGVWRMTRIWNGDQTDYGLNFTSAPQVLRVTVATY